MICSECCEPLPEQKRGRPRLLCRKRECANKRRARFNQVTREAREEERLHRDIDAYAWGQLG